MGYSETAFVEAEDQEGSYRVRYSSPRAEVTFCGHATIATGRARQGPASSRPRWRRCAGSAALAALRWQHEDLDPRYPAHVAYAGNDHLILAVTSQTRLAELDDDFDVLSVLMDEGGWTTVHLVHAHTPLPFSARDPFPPGGVVEDPATGAAAAAFGGYLHDLGSSSRPRTSSFSRARTWAAPAACTSTSPLTTIAWT